MTEIVTGGGKTNGGKMVALISLGRILGVERGTLSSPVTKAKSSRLVRGWPFDHETGASR